MKTKLIIAASLLLLLSACTDEDGARRALNAQGFHDIKTTGYRWWGCDSGKVSDDGWHTGFTAVGPTGVPVSGVVCGGIFKGNTIRFD